MSTSQLRQGFVSRPESGPQSPTSARRPRVVCTTLWRRRGSEPSVSPGNPQGGSLVNDIREVLPPAIRLEVAKALVRKRSVRPVEIREAKFNDLPRIIEIERLSFAQPWSPNSFRRELSLSFSRTLLAMRPEAGVPVVAGYLCRWLVAGEMHVLNIAVHPDHRRTGVGTALLSEAVAEAERKQAQLVILEVRRSNLPARRLYRRLGFQERRLRRNYYGPGEDALVMELMIGTPATRKRGSA